MPHFGVCLTVPQLHALAKRLEERKVAFIIKPHIRFQGERGEQWTMFFYDPSGNPIEIKGFPTLDALFQTA